MFVTNSSYKHPLSGMHADGSIQIWNAVEVELHHPWYLVEVQQLPQDEDDITLTRTVMMSRYEDVLHVYQHTPESKIVPKSLSLVSPAVDEKGPRWKIESLMEVWEADEPLDRQITAKIFVKSDGSCVVESIFRSTADQLHDWRFVCKLSPEVRN